MLKAVRSNKNNNDTNRIRVSYNFEKCYKCNKNDNLNPITNDNNGSIVYCKNCNIQFVLYEYINEDEYIAKTDKNLMMSRIFNPSAIKRASLNL